MTGTQVKLGRNLIDNKSRSAVKFYFILQPHIHISWSCLTYKLLKDENCVLQQQHYLKRKLRYFGLKTESLLTTDRTWRKVKISIKL